LKEQDRGLKLQKNSVPNRGVLAQADEWISEANEACDGLFQCEMASHTTSHRFACQENGSLVGGARLLEDKTVRFEQLRKAVWRPSPFLHVRVVKGQDRADPFQASAPALHPWVRTTSACAVGKNKEWVRRHEGLGYQDSNGCHIGL
jgi:hypothetical protein